MSHYPDKSYQDIARRPLSILTGWLIVIFCFGVWVCAFVPWAEAQPSGSSFERNQQRARWWSERGGSFSPEPAESSIENEQDVDWSEHGAEYEKGSAYSERYDYDRRSLREPDGYGLLDTPPLRRDPWYDWGYTRPRQP